MVWLDRILVKDGGGLNCGKIGEDGEEGWTECCQVRGVWAEGVEGTGSGAQQEKRKVWCGGGREQGGELAPKVSSLCSQAWKTHLPETLCLTCLSWGFQGQPDTPSCPLPPPALWHRAWAAHLPSLESPGGNCEPAGQWE